MSEIYFAQDMMPNDVDLAFDMMPNDVIRWLERCEMEAKTKGRYPLAIPAAVKGQAEDAAKQNRRSLNAELGLLIEEGFKWREAQKSQAVA